MVLGVAILKVIVLHVDERQLGKTLVYIISRSPLLSPDKLANEPKTRIIASFYCVCVCTPPWTVAHQAPLSRGFSWQEYWSEWPFLPPGDLPNLGNVNSQWKNSTDACICHQQEGAEQGGAGNIA